MADHTTPFVPQSGDEMRALVETLELARTRKKSPDSFVCKKKTYQVEGSSISVDSWKFLDQEYKKKVLPTCARGLFTCENPITGNWEIASRGYDKFFNINEVPRTKWAWIEENTKAPYELTVKENGCIIFVSGLPDDTLLVSSKHSLGPGGDPEKSHAVVGERWVMRQLEKVGKTKAEFARALREANVTAVAELCDDSFEEHILAYEGDRAGLYLHGVNLRLPKFATYSAAEFKKFASDWGFKVVDSFDKHDVKSLRQFLEEAAETGSWDGKDVEGFVIRCKARDGPDGEWHDWFFKYKFEEPYLMYRQWRECTKAMISEKVPGYKKHKVITAEYLKFAAEYFKEHPGASDEYRDNHGIIRLRDAFLQHRGQKGSDIIREEEAGAEENADNLGKEGRANPLVSSNVVLVSIATLGCGKTTIARALNYLFDWGHVQNDSIKGKKGKTQKFTSSVCIALLNSPVVFADRNNHQLREREQLIKDVSAQNRDAIFVALHYVHSRERMDLIRQTTMARVFGRGDNHQTIRAATDSRQLVEGIMNGFIDRFNPANPERHPDSDFNAVIDLDPVANSRENLEKIVTELKRLYPALIKEPPTSEDYDRAIERALASESTHPTTNAPNAPQVSKWKPQNRAIPGPSGGPQKQRWQDQQPQKRPRYSKPRKLEYFGIFLPTDRILGAVDSAFKGQPENIRRFWDQLKAANRVNPTFHVTLIHHANQKTFPDIWKKYTDLLDSAGEGANDVLGKGEVELRSVAWNERLMAIEVGLSDEWICSNRVPHITVGTASWDIKPVESNKMLGEDRRYSLRLQGHKVEGTVKVVARR